MQDRHQAREVEMKEIHAPPPWQADILSKIDHYDIQYEAPEQKHEEKPGSVVESPDDLSQARVNAILHNKPAALAALYEDIPADIQADRSLTPTKDRQAFVEKMAAISSAKGNEIKIEGEDKRADNPGDHLISLKDLLGKKGFKAYKKAIAEERNSPAFRDAVFLQSTKHYEGPKWKERMVLWVGGPSASGKSFAADALVQKVGAEHMEKDEKDTSGNNVVSVDGGVEREVSQMRQLVLQVALQKGYAGISDLHDETKLKVKRKVEKAAMATDDLSLVIPQTFTNPLENPKKQIEAYAKMPGVKQVFSKVVGGKKKSEKERFKRSVMRMGNSRAWSGKFGASDTHDRVITANNRKIGSESKIYDKAWFYAGKYFSARAREAYERAQAANGSQSIYLELTNDLIFVRKHNGKWKECETDYKGATEKLPERAFKAWMAYKDNQLENKQPVMDLPQWYKANAHLYSHPEIEASINRQKKYHTQQEASPACLENILISQIGKGGEEQKQAINSLFDIVNTMEAAAKAAFYQSLKNEKNTLGIDQTDEENLQKMIDTHTKLAYIQNEITFIQQRLRILPFYSSQINILKAKLASLQQEEVIAKNETKNLKDEMDHLRDIIQMTPDRSETTWRKIINAIPPDPLNENNIFAQTVSEVKNNNPRQGDIRRGMSRDLRYYRYVAPKGKDGAQESGPLGGWYIGCYQTPNGQIHVQRFMIKRETQFRKNIIESLCGRLQAGLVNIDQDYVAETYLVRDKRKPATGENTYAVSIGFDDFTETHKLIGLESRIRMAGTRKKIFGGDARRLFNEIKKLHTEDHYDGFEETIIGAWWTNDRDKHSGNLGVSQKMKRFLSIDHAGGMLELGVKAHPNRHGLWENMKCFLRPIRYFYDSEKRSAEPTYHTHEYPTALRNSQKMADSIKRYTNRMTAAEIKKTVNEEIDQAVENYHDDPEELKRLAKRIGISDPAFLNQSRDDLAASTKQFTYEIMHARLVNIRQYGNEIELSLCFEYSKDKKKFILAHPEKLEQFIRENPNYALHHQHHLRGRSNKKSRSFLYHTFHNKFGTGAEIEKIIHQKTDEELHRKQFLGIQTYLAKDLYIADPAERAESYIQKLQGIKKILEDESVVSPYKERIDELIEFLAIYSSEDRQKHHSTKQHLVQEFDDAYSTIQRIYETLDIENENALFAKIKIYEMLSHPETDLNTLTVNNAAFTQTVLYAAKHTESLATNIQFNTQHKKSIDTLEQKNKYIKHFTEKLEILSRNKKEEHQSSFVKIKETLEKTEEELKPKSPEWVKSKKVYPGNVQELKKENGDFIAQVKSLFNITQERRPDAPGTHIIAGAAEKSTLASAVSEDTAILIHNPNAPGRAGAVMTNQDGRTELVDFENPDTTFANTLARFLMHHAHPTTQHALRDYIQKYYINEIQNRVPPELITIENLQKDLIKPLLNHHDIKLKLPGGLFGRSGHFAESIYRDFEQHVSWNPQLIAWANHLLSMFEAQLIPISELRVETSGNHEVARLFLILAANKGADLNHANQTGYDFHITPQDRLRMEDIMTNPLNPLYATVKSAKFTDFEQTEKQLEKDLSYFQQPVTLNTLLMRIQQLLAEPLENCNAVKLQEIKDHLIHAKTELNNLDKQGKYIQLYRDVPVKMKEKIEEVEVHLHRLGLHR